MMLSDKAEARTQKKRKKHVSDVKKASPSRNRNCKDINAEEDSRLETAAVTS